MELLLILIFVAPSWIFALFYYQFALRRHLRSPELDLLNANLGKVGLYWSNSDGDFRELQPQAIEDDRKKALRTFLLMTGFLSFLSVVGMLLLILIFISGRPRLEMNTFASELVKNADLPPDQIQALIRELRSYC